MYLTDEQAKERLENKNNLSVKHNKRPEHTRGPRKTMAERVMLTELSIKEGNKAISEVFGVNPGTLSRYQRGLVSPQNGVEKNLQEAADKANGIKIKDVTEKAVGSLQKALGLVDENLDEKNLKKANQAVTVAKDLAVIVGKTQPKDESNKGVSLTVNINAPTQKKESEFEVIDV